MATKTAAGVHELFPDVSLLAMSTVLLDLFTSARPHGVAGQQALPSPLKSGWGPAASMELQHPQDVHAVVHSFLAALSTGMQLVQVDSVHG